MSTKQEKRAEDNIKSAHKREKKDKRNSIDPTSLPSPTTEVAMGVTAEDDATVKALRKAEKKQKKALKRAAGDAEAVAADVTTEVLDEGPPAKKAKKVEAVEADDEKAAKKARKEAKKAAKKAAASNGADAAPTPVASTSKVLSTTPISSTTDVSAAKAFLEEHNINLEAPEESDEKAPLPFLGFNELRGKVDDRICDEFDRLKFEKPTPIQACCWPVLLSGKDVVGIAETGSGKTFAFGVPALQKLVLSGNSSVTGGKAGKKGKGSPNVSVLVIAPTRELAKQTHDNLLMLAPSLGFGSVCLYGGVPRGEQERELYGSPSVRIVVGTPGRVLDLARDGVLDLSGVSYLVLDEADRMLDKGFEPDIRAIIGMTQSHEQGRHTSMFSATWPPAVRGLAETFMKGPIRVTVGSDELTANRRVEQSVEVLDDNRAKERRLLQLLRSIGAGPKGRNARDKVLIFALYKKEASRLEETLKRNGFSVVGIHGDMTQPQRMASLDSFKSGETPILVATDVAARGLDIPNVAHVISVTMSLTVEDYVHRIGRTARGGKSGKSTLFFTGEDKHLAGQLVRVLKDANQPVPDALMAFPQTIKKKTHSAYGDHFGELVPGKAKKITFD
ncbi:unnamed protein product [Sympodiomycopsis kandeliae]